MSRFFPFLFSVLLFSMFIVSCTNSVQESYNPMRYSDSVDSVITVLAAQKAKAMNDSAAKIDRILRDSCPELKEYIRLNKSAIAIISQVGSDKEVSKKYDKIFDSIKKEENYIMDHKFKKMSVSNGMRFIHLSVLYTNILTGSLMDQSGLNVGHTLQIGSNDSLVWKIENGK